MADPLATATYPTVEVGFYEKPWRAYTLNGPFEHPWTADEPYGRVPSVSAINGVLDKSGPLVGWAVNLTCEAAWKMDTERSSATITAPIAAKLRELAEEEISKRDPKPWLVKWLLGRADAIEREGYFMPSKWRQFKREMDYAGLSHTSATKKAQLRGTDVHQIGEDYVLHGTFPTPNEYRPELRGYVTALGKFLVRHGDGLRVAEQMVGSLTHGFAGTCDTVAVATFGDASVRLDYKTSKQVYARTHFRQLGAYELAAVECGEDATDRQAIVILGDDGEFSIHYADEVAWADSPAESFLRVLDVWRDEQPLKAHEDATYKARRARERGVAG